MSDYDSLKVPELRELCRNRGISACRGSGYIRKMNLIQILQEDDRRRSTDVSIAASSSSSAAASSYIPVPIIPFKPSPPKTAAPIFVPSTRLASGPTMKRTTLVDSDGIIIIDESDNKWRKSVRGAKTMVKLSEFERLHGSDLVIYRRSSRGRESLDIRPVSHLTEAGKVPTGSLLASLGGGSIISAEGVTYNYNKFSVLDLLSREPLAYEDLMTLCRSGFIHDILYASDSFLPRDTYQSYLRKLQRDYDITRRKRVEIEQELESLSVWSRTFGGDTSRLEQNIYELDLSEKRLSTSITSPDSVLRDYFAGVTSINEIAALLAIAPERVGGIVDATYLHANLDVIIDWIGLTKHDGVIVIDGVGHDRPDWKRNIGYLYEGTLMPTMNDFLDSYDYSSPNAVVNFPQVFNEKVLLPMNQVIKAKLNEWSEIRGPGQQRLVNAFNAVFDINSTPSLQDVEGLASIVDMTELKRVAEVTTAFNEEDQKIIDEIAQISDRTTFIATTQELVRVNKETGGKYLQVLYKIISAGADYGAPKPVGDAIGVTQPIYTSDGSYLFLFNVSDVTTIVMNRDETGRWVEVESNEDAGGQLGGDLGYIDRQTGKPMLRPAHYKLIEMPEGGAFITNSDGLGEFLSKDVIIDVFNRTNGDINLMREEFKEEIMVKRKMQGADGSQENSGEIMASRARGFTKKWNPNSAAGYDDISFAVGYVRPSRVTNQLLPLINGSATTDDCLTTGKRSVETVHSQWPLDILRQLRPDAQIPTDLSNRTVRRTTQQLLADNADLVRQEMINEIPEITILNPYPLGSNIQIYTDTPNNNYLIPLSLLKDVEVNPQDRRVTFTYEDKRITVPYVERLDRKQFLALDGGGMTMCDQGMTRSLDDGKIVIGSFNDGNGWGIKSRNAAILANEVVVEVLSELLSGSEVHSTRSIIEAHDRALFEAQSRLVIQANEGDRTGDRELVVSTTCPIFMSVINNFVHITSLGDAKVFIVSADLQDVREPTEGNRGSNDPTDPGGRIGRYLANGGPDLRTYMHSVTSLSKGDFVILCSDGIHDNLDPEMLGLTPQDTYNEVRGVYVGYMDMNDPDVARAYEGARKSYMTKKLGDILRQYAVDNNIQEMMPIHINGALVNYVHNLTLKRKIATTQMNREPEDHREYPGKIDHAGCIIYHHRSSP